MVQEPRDLGLSTYRAMKRGDYYYPITITITIIRRIMYITQHCTLEYYNEEGYVRSCVEHDS